MIASQNNVLYNAGTQYGITSFKVELESYRGKSVALSGDGALINRLFK